MNNTIADKPQCCKAEFFGGWCSELKIAYMDKITNDSYCIFHAPKGKKGISLEEFNKEVYNRILEINAKDDEIPLKLCDFSGTIFEGDIIFPSYMKYTNVCFKNVIFEGRADFDHIRFMGFTDFRKAWFKSEASFQNVNFAEAIFDKVNFVGNSKFNNSEFNGETKFFGAKFVGEANFVSVKFYDNIKFDYAIFLNICVFAFGTFKKHVGFSFVEFNSKVNFFCVKINGGASFLQTHFKSESVFQAASFKENTSFMNVKFDNGADFVGAQFQGETVFYNMNLKNYLDFSEIIISPHLVFIDNSKLLISLTDVSLKSIDFIRCGWPKKEYKLFKIEWFNQFKRNVLYDEILCDQKNNSLREVNYTGFAKILGYENVEKLYQQMKEKDRGNEPEVSNWHYGQKEMYRKKSKFRRYNPISFSNLYWAFSGYGERPMRAGFMLICFLIAITFLMNFLGIIPVNGKPINGISEIQGFPWELNIQKFWLLVNSTIQNVFFVKDPYFIPMTKLGETFLLIITKALIPIQAALFVFALRNKFRR